MPLILLSPGGEGERVAMRATAFLILTLRSLSAVHGQFDPTDPEGTPSTYRHQLPPSYAPQYRPQFERDISSPSMVPRRQGRSMRDQEYGGGAGGRTDGIYDGNAGGGLTRPTFVMQPPHLRAMDPSNNEGANINEGINHQPLIHIKVRVVEVDRSDTLDVSSVLDYFSTAGNASSITNGLPLNDSTGGLGLERFGAVSRFAIPGLISSAATGSGTLVNLTSKHINWVASLLAKEFAADTVNAPQVTTLNGKNVIFRSGSKVPFQTGANFVQDGTNTIEQVFYKHVGMYISVTPQIVNWGAKHGGLGSVPKEYASEERIRNFEGNASAHVGNPIPYDAESELTMENLKEAIELDDKSVLPSNRYGEQKLGAQGIRPDIPFNIDDITDLQNCLNRMQLELELWSSLNGAEQHELIGLIEHVNQIEAEYAAVQLEKARAVHKAASAQRIADGGYGLPNFIAPASLPRPNIGDDEKREAIKLLNKILERSDFSRFQLMDRLESGLTPRERKAAPVIERMSYSPTQEDEYVPSCDWRACECTVNLNISVRLSDAANFNADGTATAEADVRAISNVVQVQSGHGVVMGGLISLTDRKIVSKVPVLGDIPFIGAAFRSKTNLRRKTETLIFVEAEVLPPLNTNCGESIKQITASDFCNGAPHLQCDLCNGLMGEGLRIAGLMSGYLPPMSHDEALFWSDYRDQMRHAKVSTQIHDTLNP